MGIRRDALIQKEAWNPDGSKPLLAVCDTCFYDVSVTL